MFRQRMAQIGITQKETSTASQPAKVASQTKHQTQPASQPTNQPAKQNQPARQPNTDLVGESNAKNECFGKEWPKLVLLRRRHLQPASQPAKVASQTKHQTQPASQPTSQPKKTNQPGNQIQILSEKVMPKTWCLGGNDPNWYYSQRD